MKKFLATAFTVAYAGSMLLATPIYAQDQSAASVKSTLKTEMQACRTTFNTGLDQIRSDFKAKSIDRKERNARIRAAVKARQECVKAAKQKAQTALKDLRQQRKSTRKSSK